MTVIEEEEINMTALYVITQWKNYAPRFSPILLMKIAKQLIASYPSPNESESNRNISPLVHGVTTHTIRMEGDITTTAAAAESEQQTYPPNLSRVWTSLVNETR